MGSQHRDASLEEWKELLDKFTDQKAMFDAIPLAASVRLALALNLALALALTLTIALTLALALLPLTPTP